MPTVRGNMIYYSDYFAYASEAGINRARALAPAIATSVSVDVSTIVLPVNADVAVKNLSRALDMGYEWLWRDGQTLTPLQQAYIGLANYIRAKSAQEIEDYLTDEGIQVEQIYATIHNIFDETDISSGNIK